MSRDAIRKIQEDEELSRRAVPVPADARVPIDVETCRITLNSLVDHVEGCRPAEKRPLGTVVGCRGGAQVRWMQRRRRRDYRAKWPRSRYRLGPKPVAQADIAGLAEHLRKTVGGLDFVKHEIESEIVHLDVNVSLARPDRPFHVLTTSGMSALPMQVPPSTCDCCPPRIELALALPEKWPMTGLRAEERKHAWPIHWLVELARYPHRHETFLGVGHSMGSGDPDEPYLEGTSFAGAIIVPPLFLPARFEKVKTSLGPVRYLSPVPLFEVEVEYKLTHGFDALLDRLREFSPSALGPIDPERMPAC